MKHKAFLLRHGVGVDCFDGLPNGHPERQVGEHLHHTALVGKGGILHRGAVRPSLLPHLPETQLNLDSRFHPPHVEPAFYFF